MADEKPVQLLQDPLIGTRLGEYEVLEPIGEGGMGVVYRGVQPVIKKRVAIKVLKPHIAGDAMHVKRLIQEAEAVNSIGHRNIIDIFGLGQLPDGRPYVVMEFLEGEALDTHLQNTGLLPLGEALQLLIEICGPLAAAHRANVIHRDLKPSNVFLCRDHEGQRFIKLLDFGLAKKTALGLEAGAVQTSTATIAGTPAYMSPEQVRSVPVSARSDIYSLGALAFQLVTGEVPFVGENPMDVLMAHVSQPVPKARNLVPGLPDGVDALVQRMMAKDEANRPQSVEEVKAELVKLLRALPVGANVVPLTPMSQTTSLPRLATNEALRSATPSMVAPLKSKTPFIALAAVAVIVLGAVTFVALRPKAAVIPPDAPITTRTVPELPTVAPTPPAPAPVVEPPKPVEPVAVIAPTPAPKPVAVKEPRTPKPEAPAVDQLRQRVAKLEGALRKATPAGEELDPSAMVFLKKYRVEAMMVTSPKERADLSKKLDEFERTFVAR